MTAGRDRTTGARGGGALAPTVVPTARVLPSVGVLTRVARPVAGVGGLLLVKILGSPRAWAAVQRLARSCAAAGSRAAVPVSEPAADR